jgi:hypothetical protein
VTVWILTFYCTHRWRDLVSFQYGNSVACCINLRVDFGIVVDSKAPDKYVVAISQGGLGLPNRDYYLTPQFADKKAAYLAYIAQMLGLISWEAPQDSAAAILADSGNIIIAEAARVGRVVLVAGEGPGRRIEVVQAAEPSDVPLMPGLRSRAVSRPACLRQRR